MYDDRDDDEPVALYAGQMHNPGYDPNRPGAHDPHRRSKWRWVGWVAGMATIGAVFGFAIIAILKYVDGPVASMPSLKEAKASLAPTPPPESTDNSFAGDYIGFTYPGMYDVIGHLKNDSGSLEQYMITSKNNYHHQISVNVRPLPGGQLDDDASYRLRQLRTDEYELKPNKIGAESVVVAAKTNKMEQTLFWAHGGNIVTVAITSSDPKDDLVAQIKTIMATIRWKQ